MAILLLTSTSWRTEKKTFAGNCGRAGCDPKECQTKREWLAGSRNGAIEDFTICVRPPRQTQPSAGVETTLTCSIWEHWHCKGKPVWHRSVIGEPLACFSLGVSISSRCSLCELCHGWVGWTKVHFLRQINTLVKFETCFLSQLFCWVTFLGLAGM